MELPTLPPYAAQTDSWQRATAMLEQPAWPLCNMAVMLFLAGPYQHIEELAADLPDELEISSITYHAAANSLTANIKHLKIFETIKEPSLPAQQSEALPHLLDPPGLNTSDATVTMPETGNDADVFEAALARAKHRIIDQELEEINSALCGPCGCTLCCTGPSEDASQEFFEIPLFPEETERFDLEIIDTEKTRATTPYADNPLLQDKTPFFQRGPAIYRWQTGWSMILTRGSRCPALSSSGACSIYTKRPVVCRKPQIFSAILQPEQGGKLAFRNRLLAVTDCPYVRALDRQITSYAALCEADLLLKANKA